MKKFIIKLLKVIFKFLFPSQYKTAGTAAPITLSNLFYQKILRINSNAYWPVHFTSKVTGAENIKIGIGSAPGLSPGCYIQGGGKIYIGDYTIVAANVGIISANHELTDFTKHKQGVIKIGKYCWIGMNSIILPNVQLGDYTVVAAGSVVTKSFVHGYCVVGGNPARVIKHLEKDECVFYENEYKFYGYVPSKKFIKFRKDNLSV